MSKKLDITVPTLNKRLKEYFDLRDVGDIHKEELSKEQEATKVLAVNDKANDNSLQIFSNEEFGEVRVVEVNGEPWFVGKDVAAALGYERADNAIRKHVEVEDKLMHQIGASGQNRQMYVINESGLYSLILSSKLPSAKKFKRWVTSEVIPSIRKHGAYMTPKTLEKALLSPDFLIRRSYFKKS